MQVPARSTNWTGHSRLGAALVLASLAGSAVACQRSASDAPWQVAIQASDFPARPNSAEPQLTVRGDRAILSWVEVIDDQNLNSRATLKFAERTSAGWSQPRDVAAGSDWFVNSADLPSVLRLSDNTLAAHWLQTNSEDNDEAYDVRLSFSKDDGKTWTAPGTPHHDGTKTQHGFVSLFESPGGGLGLVWLDGRAMPSEDVGAMTLRAAAFDAAGKQVSDVLVNDRVCECCPTAVAVTSEGPIAAFRDRSAEEVRDIHVSRLVNGTWTAPTSVHDDGWTIPACPVNGPAIDARGADVAVAWFTAPKDEGHAFLAFSRDAGRTFGPPVRLDDAQSTGRVAVTVLTDGSAVASWIEFANNQSQFRLRRVSPSGEKSMAQTIAAAGETSGYPRIARRGDELVLAWTGSDKGALSVRTAVAPLPTGR